MKKVNVGIDLGTTYSAVAVFSPESGRVEVYKNSLGKEFTPSVVCIENGNVMIGEDAKNERKAGNVNTIACYKSMMGNPDYSAYIDGEEYSAEALSGIFLKEFVKDIEQTNNIQIDGAVITVPAYFNDKQREATIRAGRKAGLRVLKIINEPTSAIIAYGLTDGKNKTVMVYDLGGGTFDVTIAEVRGTAINVISTNGNHQLGGQDWDRVIYEEVREKFSLEHNVDIEDFEEERNELLVKCEEAKKRLSSVASTTISIQCDGLLGKYEITKDEFENKTYDQLLSQTIALIDECFREVANDKKTAFGWRDIDEVVLVGGSTRMPQVRKMIVDKYGKEPITKDINVDTIVATGAAMQAELCVNQVLNLMVASPSGSVGGSKPAVVSLMIRDDDIKDITSHSLGMIALSPDNKSYRNSVIIKKNSNVNEVYSRDYEFAGEKLLVYVLQGESEDLYETELIGYYTITGMPKGKNKIKVDFLYNSNGVVEVGAKLFDGTKLTAVKEEIFESIESVVARLKKEREEAEAAIKNIEVMFMIDTSGSMYGHPISEAKNAIRSFIGELNFDYASVAIVCFENKSTLVCPFTNDINAVKYAIDNKIEADGGTNAIPLTDYGNSFRDPRSEKIIVVLTDGEWWRPDEEIKAAKGLKSKGITIYAIGFGDAKRDFLEKIASNNGAKKIDLSSLSKTFKEIASTIATEI